RGDDDGVAIPTRLHGCDELAVAEQEQAFRRCSAQTLGSSSGISAVSSRKRPLQASSVLAQEKAALGHRAVDEYAEIRLAPEDAHVATGSGGAGLEALQGKAILGEIVHDGFDGCGFVRVSADPVDPVVPATHSTRGGARVLGPGTKIRGQISAAQ